MDKWGAFPKNVDRRNENSFKDALNTGISPLSVSQDTIILGYGWDFDEYPSLKVRKGRSNHGSSGSATTRLLTNFGNVHLVRAVGTALQYNSSGTTWSAISGTYANADWDAANFDINGPALILTNGTDTPVYWNGSSIASISQMPKGKYVAADNRRVYTAGVNGEDDVIHYCAFQNALDWTSAENSGAVQFWTNNGGPVVGLSSFSGAIWGFKKDAFCIIYHTGDSRITHRLVTISENIGCVSYKTIKQVGPYLFWLGSDNVYIGAGDGAQSIGDPIKTYFESINTSALSNACAFVYNERYYLCIPTGSNQQPDTCLVYDTRYRKWLPYSISLGGLRFGAQLNGAAYTGDNGGQTYKMNDGTTDAGNAVTWRVQSRPFDDGMLEAEKELYQMYMQGVFPTGTTVTIDVCPNDGGTDWMEIEPNSNIPSTLTVNTNLIVPLDLVPLCHLYMYRVSGSGPATLHRVQRHARIQPLQN